MKSLAIRLPKIASTVLNRSRVQAWLAFHADVPLRYISGPAGAGKTTAAVLYARGRSSAVGYLRIEPHTRVPNLYASIGAAVGCAGITSYAQLLVCLATLQRTEIIIDDIDEACSAVREALGQVYLDGVEAVTFIYLARGVGAIDLAPGVRRGLVAASDPELLTFRTDELAAYAQALGLDKDVLAITRVQRDTQGWAAAVAGVCREAAGSSTQLPQAWLRWRRLARESIADIVTDGRRHAPPHVAESFKRVVSGQEPSDQCTLSRFARYGLFVHEHDGHFRLNPLVASNIDADGGTPDGVPRAASLNMFGCFECVIGGKPIAWQRRRDREIVQYLALQPDGRATRAQLIRAFWPDADGHLAAQSLRTACSTIRRAFAACAGAQNVGNFFVAAGQVELKLEAFDMSVRRFTAEMAHADRAYDADDVGRAYRHYAAAQRLYAAPLLAGEARAGWTEPHVVRFAALYARMSERLAALSLRVTSDDVGSRSDLLPQRSA